MASAGLRRTCQLSVRRFGFQSFDFSIPWGVLLGDTTGNGTVTSSDIGQAKSQSGQALPPGNPRNDVNLTGSINASDIGIVKSRSGTALP